MVAGLFFLVERGIDQVVDLVLHQASLGVDPPRQGIISRTVFTGPVGPGQALDIFHHPAAVIVGAQDFAGLPHIIGEGLAGLSVG